MIKQIINNHFTDSQIISWLQNFNTYTAFFSKNSSANYPKASRFEWIIAVNNLGIYKYSEIDSLASKMWLFGYLSYDLKNQFEDLKSTNEEHPKNNNHSFLFQPEFIIYKETNGLLTAECYTNQNRFKILLDLLINEKSHHKYQACTKKLSANQFIDKQNYIRTVKKLQSLISEGIIYEINYCVPIPLTGTLNDIPALQKQLLEEQGAPFSAFFKHDSFHVFSSSMERFLFKEGSEVLSQPIKGTIKRGTNSNEDQLQKQKLINDEKERAENLMIVDLVRNDLSRICHSGTVKATDLFSIHPFPSVHQMISTVSGTLKKEVTITEILKATFPMGSMTGAPKLKSMEIIEKYEDFRRGIYAGSLGYIMPNKNFDFNVVIRSIIYDSKTKKLNLPVGSAITIDSVAEKEYEECLIKVEKVLSIVSNYFSSIKT